MINTLYNLSAATAAGGAGSLGTMPTFSAGQSSGPSFSDTLKNSLDEVAGLQQDAGQQVLGLATGETENLSGVMTAVEKGDLAFKTLLAIRGKLMDAYEELRGMQM